LLARRGARVLVEVQPSLKTLLAQIEGIAGIFAQGETLPDFDLHCPMMTLPLAFGTELATVPAEIPYVPVPPEGVPKWRARLGQSRALRVGIAWAGSASHINNRNRSIALSRFASLFTASNVEFVTLQKELGPGEAATLRLHPNVTVVGQELADFADTAALVSLLDLVVSADTSVAHLAGAIGRPFWLLVPFAPDFRWLLDREDSPWYPTARLFRQPRINDWESVFERVRGELERRAESRDP
jgi:ADP-heptose:LPS heptosyltransferase